MAILTVQTITSAGTTPVLTAASAGGDKWAISTNSFLHVKNASGSSINVTVVAKTTCNHGVLHNLVIAVPAGQERKVGPLDTGRFGTDNYFDVTYSAVTSVTVGAFTIN